MQRQGGRFPGFAMLLAVLLLTVAACGGGKSAQAALVNLKGVSAEAGDLMVRAADPSDFTVLSQRMDEIHA